MQITRSEKPDKEAKLEELREEYFFKYDAYLDKQGEMHYFKDDSHAKVVANTLHFWDGNKLELFCYCIMSNHVHTVFQLYDKDSEGKLVYLDVILKSIKQYSASKCNKLLARKGPFWQAESYDRLIRDHDELYRIMEYILDNPVKAGLCQNRGDWKWSYIKEKYDEFI